MDCFQDNGLDDFNINDEIKSQSDIYQLLLKMDEKMDHILQEQKELIKVLTY